MRPEISEPREDGSVVITLNISPGRDYPRNFTESQLGQFIEDLKRQYSNQNDLHEGDEIIVFVKEEEESVYEY